MDMFERYGISRDNLYKRYEGWLPFLNIAVRLPKGRFEVEWYIKSSSRDIMLNHWAHPKTVKTRIVETARSVSSKKYKDDVMNITRELAGKIDINHIPVWKNHRCQEFWRCSPSNSTVYERDILLASTKDLSKTSKSMSSQSPQTLWKGARKILVVWPTLQGIHMHYLLKRHKGTVQHQGSNLQN